MPAVRSGRFFYLEVNMSVEQNKAMVRRYFEEVMNEGKLDVVEELFAPEFGGATPSAHDVRGPECARRTALTMRNGFPDIHFTIEEIIAEGDSVVVYVTFRGTHEGEFMGVPPTGKRVESHAAEQARLRDGKIVEAVWQLHDMLDLFRQLGVLAHGHG
jgi:predicted ester cyclase